MPSKVQNRWAANRKNDNESIEFYCEDDDDYEN